MNLENKKCVPCGQIEKPLTGEESEKFLKEINNWKIIDNKLIEKDFSFKNFKEAMDLVNKVADVAELAGHHPNIYVHEYKNVKIEIFTHAIKGLSENDFIVAAKIDNLFLK